MDLARAEFTSGSQWNVSMLSVRSRFPFVAERFQNFNEPHPRLSRHNYRIDVPATRGDIGVVKCLAIVVDDFLPFGVGIGGFLNIAAEDNVRAPPLKRSPG